MPDRGLNETVVVPATGVTRTLHTTDQRKTSDIRSYLGVAEPFRDYGVKSSLTSSKLIIWDSFPTISFGREFG